MIDYDRFKGFTMTNNPIFSRAYDVCLSDDYNELASLLTDIVSLKMSIIGWLTRGPAGGNPMITVVGTKNQHDAFNQLLLK